MLWPSSFDRKARVPRSFRVLDGTPEGASWKDALSRVAKAIPHETAIHRRREAAVVLGALEKEVLRRLETDSPSEPQIFLFVVDLARFRSLKRTDDLDFTAVHDSRSESLALETVLRDGPSVGVHVIVWCDNLNVLNRAFTRAAQQDFGSRVAFQMSSSDSVHLLDAPVASRLGHHRALFVDEEQGIMEKFRPYSIPTPAWLAWAEACFHARTDPARAEASNAVGEIS